MTPIKLFAILVLFLLCATSRLHAQVVPPTFIVALVDVNAYNQALATVEQKASIAELTYDLLSFGLPPRDTTYDSLAYFHGYADGLREGARLIWMTIYFPATAIPPIIGQK